MTVESGSSSVHRPSQGWSSEVSTFEISGLILNQNSKTSGPNVFGLTVSLTWGWGGRFALGRSCPSQVTFEAP